MQGVATPGVNVVGMTMLLHFVVSFGFILVVNAPQNMVAYGTDTFEGREFVRTGLVLTVIAFALGDGARRDLLALARIRLRSRSCTTVRRYRPHHCQGEAQQDGARSPDRLWLVGGR